MDASAKPHAIKFSLIIWNSHLVDGVLAMARSAGENVFLVMAKQATVIQPTIPEFKNEYLFIHVKVNTGSVGSSNQNVFAAHMADQLPNLAQLGNPLIAVLDMIIAYASINLYVTRSQDTRREIDFNAVWNTNCINPILDSVLRSIDTLSIFYHTEHLAKVQIKLPIKTWGQWQGAMDQLINTSGLSLCHIYIHFNEYEPFISFALCSDDPLLSNNDHYAHFKSAALQRVLHFFYPSFIHHWLPLFSIAEFSKISSTFFNSRLVVFFKGQWNHHEFCHFQLRGMELSWNVMPILGPKGKSGGLAGVFVNE